MKRGGLRLVFLQKFIKSIEFLNITENILDLLFFDGHSSHTKNLPVIDAVRENRIILLCYIVRTKQNYVVYYSRKHQTHIKIKMLENCNPCKFVTLGHCYFIIR